MQDKDCRKNEISYIALLPVAPPLDEIDQRQKHQVRYNLIRMYAPFLQHTEPHAHTDTSTIIYLFYSVSTLSFYLHPNMKITSRYIPVLSAILKKRKKGFDETADWISYEV